MFFPLSTDGSTLKLLCKICSKNLDVKSLSACFPFDTIAQWEKDMLVKFNTSVIQTTNFHLCGCMRIDLWRPIILNGLWNSSSPRKPSGYDHLLEFARKLDSTALINIWQHFLYSIFTRVRSKQKISSLSKVEVSSPHLHVLIELKKNLRGLVSVELFTTTPSTDEISWASRYSIAVCMAWILTIYIPWFHQPWSGPTVPYIQWWISFVYN